MLLDHPLFLSFSLLDYLYSFPVDCIPHPKFPWTQTELVGKDSGFEPRMIQFRAWIPIYSARPMCHCCHPSCHCHGDQMWRAEELKLLEIRVLLWEWRGQLWNVKGVEESHSHSQLSLETGSSAILYPIGNMFPEVVYFSATQCGPRTSKQDKNKNWDCVETFGRTTSSK